jgi:hypothetical protein
MSDFNYRKDRPLTSTALKIAPSQRQAADVPDGSFDKAMWGDGDALPSSGT